MKNVKDHKTRLEQKKNRLAAEEIKLRLKERKMRTRHLIELGGLMVKAGLEHLPSPTIYGALLYLGETLQDNPDIKAKWTTRGTTAFKKEQQEKTAVILKLSQQPDADIRGKIREHGLKWNRIRQEWYGHANDLPALKKSLANVEHSIEVIEN